MMNGFIELKHINKDRRQKKVKDTAKNISNGAGKIFKAISKGVSKVAKDIQERQKPENQIKRLKAQKELLIAKGEVMKEQQKINKLKPKDTGSGMGGLSGLVGNASKTMEDMFGTNVFNDNKNNRRLI